MEPYHTVRYRICTHAAAHTPRSSMDVINLPTPPRPPNLFCLRDHLSLSACVIIAKLPRSESQSHVTKKKIKTKSGSINYYYYFSSQPIAGSGLTYHSPSPFLFNILLPLTYNLIDSGQPNQPLDFCLLFFANFAPARSRIFCPGTLFRTRLSTLFRCNPR
jgi:hypothetical protein